MNKRYLYPLLTVFSGVLTGFSVILPQYFGFLQWVCLAPAIFILIHLCREKSRYCKIYLFGFVYFLSFYLVCFHFFLKLYPLEFTGISPVAALGVVLLGWVGLSLFQSAMGGLIFLFVGLISKLGKPKFSALCVVIFFPLLYAVLEYSQTIGWWGVPWARLCLGQTYFLPLISTSSLFGSYFVSAIIVFVNCSLAYAFVNRRKVKLCKLSALMAISAFSLNLITGSIIYGLSVRSFNSSEKQKMAVIQGNFSSSEKWIASFEETFEVYSDYTRLAVADGAKIVLWPETAIPYPLTEDSVFAELIQDLAYECNITLCFGALSFDESGAHNCIYFVTPDGEFKDEVYQKRHLVPFGEYLPMAGFINKFFPALGEIAMLDYDIIPGQDTSVFEIEDFGKIGSLICFDSIYEGLAANTVRDGAEIIFLATNDSWFTDSAAVYMHNNQAKLRSIEFNRCTLRAANTGVSSFITSYGGVLNEIPPLEDGYLCGELSTNAYRTLYSYIGNTFVILSAIAAGAYFAVLIFINLKKKPTDTELFEKGNNDGKEKDIL